VAVALGQDVRLPGGGIAEGHQQLEQQRVWVGLGVRRDGPHELTGQAIPPRLGQWGWVAHYAVRMKRM
jgi:hypothetical protein